MVGIKKDLNIFSAFSTPMLFEHSPEYLDLLNNFCDPLLTTDAKFGDTTQSENIFNETKIAEFVDFCKNKRIQFLDTSGFDLNDCLFEYDSMWVQQFSSRGGGNHYTHVHSGSYVSGFYFLKCSENTSYPIWHDPRAGALMNRLPVKKESNFSFANDKIYSKPKPGAMILFPSYLPHHFTVDSGKEPFRFIHWNLKCQKK